ncbi:hypothetical protein H4218_005618 [Coemansia sp. IMI 209128]|nr:hypothetical protein H4218_005618 [Coemansia sp. IMI 209128]
MSLPSQFQQLPKKVLKSICKHVMPIIGDNTGPRPGIALLRTDWFDSLGSAWREVALEHYFEHFTLAFNSGSGKINSTHPVDDGFISIERECHTLTAVKICVAMNDLLSGKAAHMLAKSKYSPLVFPSVETMKIDINEFYKSAMVGEWETEDIYSTVTELTLFKKFSFSGKYELVRKCAPTLKKLTMHDYTGQDVLSVFTEASGKPVEYPRADFYSVCSLIEKMPQLVRLCVEELEIESDYDYTCRSKLYNDFTSEWPVLSHQFKYCDVVRETNIEDLATFGMLLAVMCPRFTRFMSNSRSWKLVQEEIDAAILEEPFIEHAEKLKLLTYNGIPEGSETFAVKQVYW